MTEATQNPETTTISGECLCGAVKFEIANSFEKLFFCNCRQCRQITGSAFASNLMAWATSFRWLAGADNVVRYKLPDRNITKAFCRQCGSGLPYLSDDGKRVVIPAGALDGPPDVAEKYQIFLGEQADWAEESHTSPGFDGFPE